MTWRKEFSLLQRAGLWGVLLAAGVLGVEPFSNPFQVSLKDERNQDIKLTSFRKDEQLWVLWFTASTCPISFAYYPRIRTYVESRQTKVQFIVVGGNSDDSIKELKELLDRHDLGELPMVWDEQHRLAKLLGIEYTPEVVVLDGEGKAYYRGQIDNSWRDPSKVTEPYLENAIDSALKGDTTPDRLQEKFMGSRLR